MEIEKLPFSLVKYSITQLQLFTPGLSKPYDIPVDAVVSMTIDNMYESHIFPFFEIEVDLPATVLRPVLKTPHENYIKIKLQSGYYDSPESKDAKSASTFIENKYIAFIDSQYRNLFDSKLEEVEKKEGYSYTSNNPNTNRVVKFALYDEKLLDAKELVFNEVFSSGCLIDFVTYVLNSAKIDNVLISPPNNYKVYNEFIITPISAYDQLDRICNDYAIYDYEALIYFGLERNYILSRSPECTAFIANEYKTTCFYYSETDRKMATSAACAKSNTDKTNYVLVQGQSASFEDLSYESEYAITDKEFNLIDNSTGKVTTGKKNKEYKVMVSGDENIKNIKNMISSYSKIATLGLRNVDLEMLTPNKKFTFLIQDKAFKKYATSCILSRTTIKFFKEGKTFTPIVQAIFRAK